MVFSKIGKSWSISVHFCAVPPSQIIYISSAARSGSTLLDQMLASHPDIVSIGEAQQLKAYALQDRRFYDPVHPLVCSCGQSVPNCLFWQDIQKRMDRQLSSLTLVPRLVNANPSKRPHQKKATSLLLARALNRWPSLYRIRAIHSLVSGNKVGNDSALLFDKIAESTGARFIVDSSKMPFRFWSLNKSRPGDVWLILLCRDYKAVAHSFAKRSRVKREQSLIAGVISWKQRLHQMDVLSQDLPRDRVIRVRYEDLCNSPGKTMRELCQFLGLDFTPEMLNRAKENLHHLGGSPSKFERNKKKIQLDTDYLRHLTEHEEKQMRCLAGKYARTWGYN